MVIKTIGIVLSESNYSDSDKIINVLTPLYGKISVIAKNGRSSKSRYIYATEPFCITEFTLYDGRSMYHLNEARLLEANIDLRKDYEKIELASNILKKVSRLSEGINEKSEIYNLFKLTYFFLIYMSKCNSEKNKIVYYTYILKAMQIEGYGLNIAEIEKNSAEKERIYIESEDIYIPKIVFDVIKYVSNAEIEKVYNFNVTKELLKEVEKFIKIYMENHDIY